MLEFFFSPENMPFGVAAAVMFGLMVLEGVGLMISVSPSGFLDHAVPDADGAALDWLHIGKVPALVLLVLFLMGFSVSGYLIQILSTSIFDAHIYAWAASIPAVLSALTLVHVLGGLIGRLVPKDQTSAVSEKELIGLTGYIVTGTARFGKPAEIKLRDRFGNPHFLMIEPGSDLEEFEEGSEVVVLEKIGAFYRGNKTN